MSHSFEDLYNLYNNQPDDINAGIDYFRENNIRRIDIKQRDDQAEIVMIDTDGAVHRASGQMPAPPPQDSQAPVVEKDEGYEGNVTDDPLTKQERSLVDPNPDTRFFMSADAYHNGPVPRNIFDGLSMDNQGQWFKTYREGLRYRYNPPRETINDPTSAEDLLRIQETSALKFKYKFIKSMAINLKPLKFPFTVKTRAANRNPRNLREPAIKVPFTLKDAIYFATLHPHIIAGFLRTGASFKLLYLEDMSDDDAPGTVYAREVMQTRRMFIPTATNPPRKPITPTTAQTTLTKVERQEIKKASESVQKQVSETERSVTETPGQAASAIQLDGSKPSNRQILFATNLALGANRTWLSQMPNAKSRQDVATVGNLVAKQLNKIMQAVDDEGLLEVENQPKFINIDEYVGDFYDTTFDPQKNKLDYEIKRVGSYVFIQKLHNPPTPTDAEEDEEEDSANISSETKPSEAVNYDDWTTNAPDQRGATICYLNPRYPESISPTGGPSSYFVVMRAPTGVDTQQQYADRAANLRNTMYQALCKKYNKPVTDMPSEIPFEQKPYFYARPNAAPLILLVIRQEDFEEIAAFGNIKSNLDELTLQRAILASQRRADKNISFDLETMDALFAKVSKTTKRYANTITKQGLRKSDVGVNLHAIALRLEQFPERLRMALTYNGVFPDPGDQIQMGFTNEYEPLHIIHKSTMHFGGFKRNTIEDELAPPNANQGQNPMQNMEPENQFPPELLTGEDYFPRYDKTTFGYVFYAQDMDKNIYADQMIPWVDFIRDFTFPAPKINPTTVNDRPKNASEDEDFPSMDLTDMATDIEGDNLTSTDQSYADKPSSSSSNQTRSLTQGQKVSEAQNIQSFNKKAKNLERRVKSLEPLVEDAVMNCGNLPNLLDQIKELEDLFDLVLDGISLDELFASLRDSLLQDLQKLFAMKDIAEGFTPDLLAGGNAGVSNQQGVGLSDALLSARASDLVCSPSSQFEEFLQNDLACALDQIGDSLKNKLLDRNNINNIPLDQLINDIDKVRNLFGIRIPFIPIEGLLSFILKLVIEILKEVLKQVLVALVQEALEKFLNCDNIPTLEGDLAKLGDIVNPAQLLDYGRSQLENLIEGIDIERLLDKLGIEIPLEQLMAIFKKVSDALNTMEMLALLSGNAGPLIMRIVRDQFEGLLPDDIIDLLFEKIGDNIPQEIKSDIVPEEFYVDYCNKGDYVRAAVAGLQLLRDKGLSNEDIKNQTDDEIKRAADKIKSMCDFEDLANNALVNALNNIPAPDAIMSLQNESSAATSGLDQAFILADAKAFILGRTPPKYGGFDIGSIPLSPFDEGTYGTEQIITEENLDLRGSGGEDAERVAISYEANNDQFKIGDLKITVSEPTESQDDFDPNAQLNNPTDVNTNQITIIVHRTTLNTNALLDEEGQFRRETTEALKNNRDVLVFLQTQADRVYSKTKATSNQQTGQISRPEWSRWIRQMLKSHQEEVYGFGITSEEIINSHIRGSEADGSAAYIRPPQAHEEGKYPYPFIDSVVLDRGNDMELFNAYFRKDDINTKPNPRQQYFDSGLFNSGRVYEKLYDGLIDEPKLVNAGPIYEKRIKRTNTVSGICNRIAPFLCAIWPILDTSETSKIRFCAPDGNIDTDRVFREIIQNYLLRMVIFSLQNSGVYDLYRKVLAEDNFDIEAVVQIYLEGIFVDSPTKNNHTVYEDISLNDLWTDASGEDYDDYVWIGNEQEARFPDQVQNRARTFAFEDVRAQITRNMYPVEVLLAASTIYLHASSNTTSLLGATFTQAIGYADGMLKKLLVNPIL